MTCAFDRIGGLWILSVNMFPTICVHTECFPIYTPLVTVVYRIRSLRRIPLKVSVEITRVFKSLPCSRTFLKVQMLVWFSIVNRLFWHCFVQQNGLFREYYTTFSWSLMITQASNFGQWSVPCTQLPINDAIILGTVCWLFQQSSYM